tara:strand:+ start:1652 stop:1927 length:276 start_codon:yes stop_codon:yes gene_type:complete
MKKSNIFIIALSVLLLVLNFSTYKTIKVEFKDSHSLESVYPFRSTSLVFIDGTAASCKKTVKYWSFSQDQNTKIKLTYSKNIFGFLTIEAI